MSAYFCGRFVPSASMLKDLMLLVSFSIFGLILTREQERFFFFFWRERERERVDEEEDVDYEGALYIDYVHEKRVWWM